MIGYGGTISIPSPALVVDEHAVVGNLVGTWIDLWELLQLHAAGRIVLKTEVHPLDASTRCSGVFETATSTAAPSSSRAERTRDRRGVIRHNRCRAGKDYAARAGGSTPSSSEALAQARRPSRCRRAHQRDAAGRPARPTPPGAPPPGSPSSPRGA